jgi:hypothetical protein
VEPTLTRARVALCALAAFALFALSPSTASAAQSARISASFTPERLGAPTTATLGFQIVAPARQIPSPLTAMDFRYPANLGIATSGLGVASCDPARLEADGPSACPADSIMGYGSASVEVPLGGEVVPETASIVLVAGPSENGYLRLLVCATGLTPVAARIVMPTLLIAGHLHISVPLVPSLPEGPDVAVVRAQVKLGGHLTYYEHVHGRIIAYHPKGIVLPRRCPRGGFRFSATFSFLDGTQTRAQTIVRCPGRR